MLVRSGSGEVLATASGIFVTGTLSPARADSSICRSCAAPSRLSSATICRRRIRRSPRRNSAVRISRSSPLRMMRAVRAERDRRASSASARQSVADPMRPKEDRREDRQGAAGVSEEQGCDAGNEQDEDHVPLSRVQRIRQCVARLENPWCRRSGELGERSSIREARLRRGSNSRATPRRSGGASLEPGNVGLSTCGSWSNQWTARRLSRVDAIRRIARNGPGRDRRVWKNETARLASGGSRSEGV